MADEVRTSEEIFKEFKEHSITEFFRKNSQMLGYSGKVRSLTTVVHEYVTNSVTHDTPTVVMSNGRVAITEIGDLVDRFLLENKDRVASEGGVESLRNLGGLAVLCFDKESLRLKFKPVKSIHRHRMEKSEKVITIRVVGGATVDATRHHSLFTIDGGMVTPVKAADLSVGKYIVVPSRGWAQECDLISELNIIEELLGLPSETTQKISIYGVKKLLDANQGIKEKIKSQLSAKDRHYTFYSYYMKCDRLPLHLIRNLTRDERAVFYGCKVGWKKGAKPVENILRIDIDFARFLGLFTAEGSVRSNMHSIALSFGVHENELIALTKQLVWKIFHITPKVMKAHPSAVNITVGSTTVAFIMKHVFGYGHSAKTKAIPQVVFNLSRLKMEQFAVGYLAGDGYPSKIFTDMLFGKARLQESNFKATAATASKRLATHLSYLLSALGYTCSLQNSDAETRLVNGKEAHFGNSHIIEFWTRQKCSPLDYYPITEGGIGEIKDSELRWSISRRSQQTIMISRIRSLGDRVTVAPEAAKFLDGDLSVVKIANIDVRDANLEEYVYDYSVEGDENFVGGSGPICLHNSLDACEEAGALPSIEVGVKELGESKYGIRVQDNGPGIPRKMVGKALASVLSGTKFHRYMQQRGQQGIGAAGCTLFALITTGKGIHVRAGTGKEAYECDLTIDIKFEQARRQQPRRPAQGLPRALGLRRVRRRQVREGRPRRLRVHKEDRALQPPRKHEAHRARWHGGRLPEVRRRDAEEAEADKAAPARGEHERPAGLRQDERKQEGLLFPRGGLLQDDARQGQGAGRARQGGGLREGAEGPELGGRGGARRGLQAGEVDSPGDGLHVRP